VLVAFLNSYLKADPGGADKAIREMISVNKDGSYNVSLPGSKKSPIRVEPLTNGERLFNAPQELGQNGDWVNVLRFALVEAGAVELGPKILDALSGNKTRLAKSRYYNPLKVGMLISGNVTFAHSLVNSVGGGMADKKFELLTGISKKELQLSNILQMVKEGEIVLTGGRAFKDAIFQKSSECREAHLEDKGSTPIAGHFLNGHVFGVEGVSDDGKHLYIRHNIDAEGEDLKNSEYSQSVNDNISVIPIDKVREVFDILFVTKLPSKS